MKTSPALKVLMLSSALLMACACVQQRLPPDFRPDPTLLSRIESISIKTPPFVCPGQNLKAAYEAKLDDGTIVPFATEYEKDNPPPLHISFLSRTSPEATALEDGTWDTSPSPLRGATTGYRLNALLLHKSSVHAQHVVEPEYSCLPHEFRFSGDPGEPGRRVTVRLDILSSPFVDRLLVAEIGAAGYAPYFLLADADKLPRIDWLVVESRGGRGVPGQAGRTGSSGRSGSSGCPGTAGGPGGSGRRGGPGGAGGIGGEIFLIVPEGETRLAWLVKASAPGGAGGPGGQGGPGGAGGSGGDGIGEGCSSGSHGPSGRSGATGSRGTTGQDGPGMQVVEFPRERVFRTNGPPALWALLEYSRTGSREEGGEQ
jgi:hypothetical protein